MNVVGYKGERPGARADGARSFYMNVVGYKVLQAYERQAKQKFVLYERSGI